MDQQTGKDKTEKVRKLGRRTGVETAGLPSGDKEEEEQKKPQKRRSKDTTKAIP